MNTPILNLPYPTSADTADVPRDLQALALAMDPLGTVPVGALMLWPVALAPTTAWLLCKGQQVDAATYPALALVLGSTAGKILVPDFTDVFPVGAGANALLATGGAATVKLALAELPAHAHVVTDPGHGHGSAGAHNHGAGTGNSNQSLDHEHDAGVLRAGWPSGAPANWPMSLGSGYSVPSSNIQGASFSPSSGGIAGGPGSLTNHNHGISTDGAHTHANANSGITLQNSGGGNAHENRPPFRAVNFIIRAL